MALSKSFRSTYFACLAMAAEMSTGALAMAHLYHSDPPVSMLVVKLESEYFKKPWAERTFIVRMAIPLKIRSNSVFARAKLVKWRPILSGKIKMAR